jgi:hypothetical protein
VKLQGHLTSITGDVEITEYERSSDSSSSSDDEGDTGDGEDGEGDGGSSEGSGHVDVGGDFGSSEEEDVEDVE